MGRKRHDFSQAEELYAKGFSLEQVAAVYGVTRQSMWDTLKRRGTVFRPQKRYGADNVFFRGGVVTQCFRARQLVILAVEKGILVAPKSCVLCGAEGRVEGHHDDYRQPLSVRWLCHKCHYEWHKGHVAIENPNPDPPKSRFEICSMGGKANRKRPRESGA